MSKRDFNGTEISEEYILNQHREQLVFGTPLRVVLLGTTGAGKSATGNTLLGTKKFTSSPGRKSCTEECSVAEVDRFGRRLVVVDTPGVLDTGMHERDLKEILKECTQLACPGVHAFLFVMKIGERDIYTKDQKTFELFTELLSKEFLDHTIVVFTAKECLGEVPLDHFVSDLPDTCKAFIESCKGGYLAISNFSTDEKEEAEQVVEKVKGLVQKNDDRYYKNVLLDEQNKEIQKRMEVDLKRNDDIWKQITQTERGKQRLMTKHKVHGLTDDERKELTKLENIIFKLKEKIIQRKVVRINAIHGIQREQNMKQAIVVGVAVVGVGVGVGVAAAIASQAPVAGLVAVASEAVLTKRK